MDPKNKLWLVISSVVSLFLLALVLARPQSAHAQTGADQPGAIGLPASLPEAVSAQLSSQDFYAPAFAAGAPAVKAAQIENCTLWHDILPGDTLYKIGLKYGLSWRALADLNQMGNPNLIYAGTKLCIRTGDSPSTSPAPSPTPSVKVPTFKIDAVTHDQSVTITTSNFPANDSFAVYMGAFGTKGVNGTKVDTVSSGQGGSFTATFIIPASLKGSSLIAIRLQSTTSGYYSYNWFYNQTTK